MHWTRLFSERPTPNETPGQPYSVATHSARFQLLQPRNGNPFGVFIVAESEAISIQHERDEKDPRIGL
ncbi:MAG: hypothetical protein IPM98_13370, partial [Lewinellaceae bacterium]|nr:hypothetical protein [Lewinellaceae bacterium]